DVPRLDARNVRPKAYRSERGPLASALGASVFWIDSSVTGPGPTEQQPAGRGARGAVLDGRTSAFPGNWILRLTVRSNLTVRHGRAGRARSSQKGCCCKDCSYMGFIVSVDAPITAVKGNVASPARTRGSIARSRSRRSVQGSIPLARDQARTGRPPRDSVPAYACPPSAARTSLVTS